MKFKNYISLLILLLTLTLNAFSQDYPFMRSFDEFVKWEKNLKLNAKFHPQYKTPDYVLVGLRDSSPESAKGRYSFLMNNPQYVSDYENIHKGKLSTQATDGSSLIKSRFEDMPPEIAEHYKKNPSELLAAEGFNMDPVLARKVYTGEIKLPYGVSTTEWLQTHAWTPNGIIEKNITVANANTDYSGGYVLDKNNPDTQVKKLLELLNTIQKDIATIVSKAGTVHESIAVSLKTSDNGAESIDCASKKIPSTYIGRCKELLVLIKAYNDLEANAEKTRNIISSLDKTIGFPKIALDVSVMKTSVYKTTKDVFAADKEAPNCALPVLQGWKCLKTTITTLEGKDYNILLKWNRPLKKSKGTVFYGVGGAGVDESLEDPNFKTAVNELDQIDNVRFVALEMLDENPAYPLAGGYWIHGGGYDSLAQVFMAAFELAVNKNLFHGNFLNYTGGSNGTTMISSAMARFNADSYFDRVVLHAGPFLPSLATACDKNSPSSFYRSNQAQVNTIMEFLSYWVHKEPGKKVCDDLANDKLSVLKPGLKKDYPNTIVHVVMGQKEVTEGFGHWILNSNLEWYNSITAKAKERIVRPDEGHNYSFRDMRRFLKIGPDETPAQ